MFMDALTVGSMDPLMDVPPKFLESLRHNSISLSYCGIAGNSCWTPILRVGFCRGKRKRSVSGQCYLKVEALCWNLMRPAFPQLVVVYYILMGKSKLWLGLRSLEMWIEPSCDWMCSERRETMCPKFWKSNVKGVTTTDKQGNVLDYARKPGYILWSEYSCQYMT